MVLQGSVEKPEGGFCGKGMVDDATAFKGLSSATKVVGRGRAEELEGSSSVV